MKKGLEDVVVLETKISFIDGKNGILKYRGYDINELTDYSYEAVSYLLLYGKLPTENELNSFSHQLRELRPIREGIKGVTKVYNINIEAMDALRTTTSYMSHFDPDLNNESLGARLHIAMRLIAKFPTIVAAFRRIRKEKEPVVPDPSLSHGENFLYMLTGKKPDPLDAEVMEKDFIISAEHELNVSTFSARITASTQSDFYSAIISGIGTLNGPLHGGARMNVMNMLDAIGTPDKAEDYVMNLISQKKKIMGFGHRVYKTWDPRGKIFKDLVKRLAEARNDYTWWDTATRIEETVLHELVEKRGKPIYPNVDFYTGVAYKYLGIPPLLATTVFAIGRVSGWSAHILEQFADNRIIRPRAKYVNASQ
jgi:citrate synthase